MLQNSVTPFVFKAYTHIHKKANIIHTENINGGNSQGTEDHRWLKKFVLNLPIFSKFYTYITFVIRKKSSFKEHKQGYKDHQGFKGIPLELEYTNIQVTQ